MLSGYPEVLAFSRIGFFGNHVLKYEDKVYRESHVYSADENFFQVFSLPLVKGNPRNVLSQPNSIVMTETAARKYFGNENPVGKILEADSSGSFIVTGLMKDLPANSSFRCDILISMSTYPAANNNDWLNMSYTTYVVLKKGADPQVFEKKLQKITNDYVGPQAEAVLGISFREFLDKGNKWGLYIQPLTSIYLYSKSKYGIDPNVEWLDQKTSDIEYVYMFLAVAVFILLLAIINFINLTTARSETRSKEVGIKKTLGSNKSKLIRQFLTESILVAMLSVFISILIIEVTLPFFNRLAEKDLKLELFSDIFTIPGLILFAVIIGIISGSYPAFFLSSLRPAHLFKSSTEKMNRKSILRSGLVVVQFAISISLLIGTVIIRNQINFIQNRNLGFDRENLYVIKNFGVPDSKLQLFKQVLSKNPDVISVTNSSMMFLSGVPGDGYSYNDRQISNNISSQYLDVDYNFLKTFQIQLLRGRFFSREFPSDTISVVINEAMSKECGTGDPIGNDIIKSGTQSRTYKIIGVIKDFNYQSLHQQIKPLVLFLSPVRQPASIVTVRISSMNIANTIASINNTWKQLTGGEEINSSFMNQDLARLYGSEKKASTVATVFSGLAIVIACLGLFGLVSYVTEQRKKEIGIRKVLGASVFRLIIMLSKEFTKLVLIANLIAWPAAYLIMNNWLANYAYRINIGFGIFLLSGVIALIIALATVSFLAMKAALADPVKSLKYE
jgi:putative ABC transport system permease protein